MPPGITDIKVIMECEIDVRLLTMPEYALRDLPGGNFVALKLGNNKLMIYKKAKGNQYPGESHLESALSWVFVQVTGIRRHTDIINECTAYDQCKVSGDTSVWCGVSL